MTTVDTEPPLGDPSGVGPQKPVADEQAKQNLRPPLKRGLGPEGDAHSPISDAQRWTILFDYMTYPAHGNGEQVLQETRGFNILFIHSSLDDAKLTASEFRVFAHLSRRAGDGASWASVETMATTCRLHPDTVWKALKGLEQRRMIRRETRHGKTSLIRLTAPSEWLMTEPTPQSQAPESEGWHPPESEGHHPPESEGHEGNPTRVSKEGDPISPEVLEIYQTYPLKVGKPKALAAIKAALKTIEAPRLLELTRAFSRARPPGTPFTPHPATWFNQQRFNDDPSTWEHGAPFAGPARVTHDLKAKDFAL